MNAFNLVADIGGTNCRLALCAQNSTNLLDIKTLSTKHFSSVESAIDSYLNEKSIAIERASLAVAGPVSGADFDFTNNHWSIETNRMKSYFNWQEVNLINDFHAIALATDLVEPAELLSLKAAPMNEDLTQIVIGPGTGIGLAFINRQKNRVTIGDTEGGHASFAPETKLEIEVFKYLSKKTPYVSYESVLSGRGLENLYFALNQILAQKNETINAEQISKQASEQSSFSRFVIDTYCGILGNYCRNAALYLGARGGIFLAGGILPKIKDLLLVSPFLKRFQIEGQFENYLKAIGIQLITYQHSGLLGAAKHLNNKVIN